MSRGGLLMIDYRLGKVMLTDRVFIEIHMNAGGELEPRDLVVIGQLLQWIGRATRKWRRGAHVVTPVVEQV